jgi:hypothetical protein
MRQWGGNGVKEAIDLPEWFAWTEAVGQVMAQRILRDLMAQFTAALPEMARQRYLADQLRWAEWKEKRACP